MSTLEFTETDREGSQGEAEGLFGCESWVSEESGVNFGRPLDELAEAKETADGLRAIWIVVDIVEPPETGSGSPKEQPRDTSYSKPLHIDYGSAQ